MQIKVEFLYQVVDEQKLTMMGWLFANVPKLAEYCFKRNVSQQRLAELFATLAEFRGRLGELAMAHTILGREELAEFFP